jgi:hypothetical protein
MNAPSPTMTATTDDDAEVGTHMPPETDEADIPDSVKRFLDGIESHL